MPKAPVRDIVMYYEEAGSGDPLVLIMGLGGDLQAWAFQVPELAKKFRVITLDNRGSGRTSSPDRPYTIAGMADDVAALLDHLDIPRAHILGFSMGGFIAQELALRHPAKVDRLVLLGTTARPDAYTRNLVRSWVDVRRSNMSREQIQRLTANWLYTPEFIADEERFERAILNGLNNPYAQQDHAFIRQAHAVLEFDCADRAKNIKQETLVLCGRDDVLVLPGSSEELSKLLPKARLLELAGGHVGLVEYPEEYNAAVLEFLTAAG